MSLLTSTRGRALAAVGLSVTLTAAVTAPVAAATPAVGPKLPVESFVQLVTDPGTGNVYLSSGVENTVVVADPAGKVLTQIPDLDGAFGLAVHGDTLYVGLRDAHAIAAIDTRTLRERTRYPTGPKACPSYLAATVSTLWFSYDDCSDRPTGLGKLPLAGAAPRVTLDQHGRFDFYWSPRLVAAPNGPLVASVPDISSATANSFRLAAGRLTYQASTEHRVLPSSLRQLTLTPDGSRVLVAAGGTEVVVLDSATLRPVGGYPVTEQDDMLPEGRGIAQAVAVSPNNQLVAVGHWDRDDQDTADVLVYRSGSKQPFRAYDFGYLRGGDHVISEHGLAWSPDASRLYAVTEEGDGGLKLRVLTPNQ